MSSSFYKKPALRRYARARVIAGFFALCCAAPASAAPLISISTSFTAADSARNAVAIPYMDSGGVWDGNAEVTNTTGDTFSITISNSAAGAPDPLVNDVAFDIDLTVDVPAGFRLPFALSYPVIASNSGGGANCTAPSGVTASQSGNTINFDFPADVNLPAQSGAAQPCRYTFSFGLTTSDVAPFVATGTYTLNYRFSYNQTDNNAASQQIATASRDVPVKRGDLIVTKTAVPNPGDTNGAYADGETAEWTVSLFNNGSGGTFAATVVDTLNANFDAATLQLTPPASPSGAPFPVPQGVNQYTLNYLQRGQQVDIAVRARVAVPAGATSCPDLRNNVTAEDRLGNTSSAFASVELDLQDPLLDYTPDNFTIDFGTPTTVDFDVSNTGSGTARNVELAVGGLAGISISNVSAQWIYDVPTATFIYLGPDMIAGSGDEVIAAGASVPLQFDASMNTCGGPTGGFLVWTPRYENICGLAFTPPIRNTTYSVNNFPNLTLNKSVAPTATNFGVPASYTISLSGSNIAALASVPGADNDWRVTDTFPAGVGGGNIPAVPAGTIITIGGTTYTDADANIAVTAGDTIVWEGDQSDLLPAPPSITVNFTVDSANYCPPDPPVTFTNTATLQYPSCGFNVADSAPVLVNDSPVDTVVNVFSLAGGMNPPFETGRPDTDLIPDNEPNEGERITFSASYPFPAGYPGQWSGSAFAAEMGTGTGGLAGRPLQLAFSDSNGNDVPDTAEITGVTVEVINPNGAGFPLTNLPVGTGAGEVTINPGGDIEISDLGFIEAVVGSPSMAEMTLNITYTVTAPEGNLDANLQPADDSNIGIFDERVHLTVAGDNTSCAGNNEFVQGVGVALARADVFLFGDIDSTNDAGACGITTASVDVFGPQAGTLSADNIRILLQSTDYALPTNAADFSIGGAGNLASLNPTITFPTPGQTVQIEVTPNDGDNLEDLSRITFPITLNGGAPGRDIQASIYFDSKHTSPDFSAAIDGDEDYTNASVLSGPVQTANLNVSFFPPNVILGDPTEFADVDGVPGQEGVFSWRVRITNVGASTLSNYVFTNEVPPGFLPYRSGGPNASNPPADPGLLTDPLMVWSSLPALAPGASTEIKVAIGLARSAGCNVGNPNQTTIYFGCTNGTALYNQSGPTIDFPVIDLELDHRDNSSYCELCREGSVDLDVRNEGASDLYNVTVTESLAGSGLEYVPGSTEVSVEGGSGFVAVADHPMTTPTQIVWDPSVIADLGRLYSDLVDTPPSQLTIRFQVRSSDANPENLLSATRNISASAHFDLFCGDPGVAPAVDNFKVPLHQPQPTVDKQGRNYSARQAGAQYSDPVFGGTDDVLVWRVDVQNSGISSSADLEDLLVNDTIGGNFNMRYICPSEASAAAMAAALETELFAASPAPAPLAPCILYNPLNPPLDVDDPFGNPANDEPGAHIDATAGESAYTYYVGEVAALCQNHNNSANIEWGCEAASPPAGGISALTPGVVNADDSDSAQMSTEVDPSGVQIQQTVTGVNPSQAVGTRGIVTVTLTNNSGGTIRNLVLADTVPADYEIDLTSLNPPNAPLAVNSAYGDYPGIIDGYTADTTDPTAPEFSFTSSTQGTVNQSRLLRNGDQLVLTFQIIRVRPFDDVNNPEIRTEDPSTAPPSDPAYATSGSNAVSLQFEDTCSNVFNSNPPALTVPIDPEDIDVDINPTDPNLVYILSDPAATLLLDVVVTNNGGHDASNYDTWVTIGNGIEIVGGLPAGCTGPVAPPAEIGEPPANPGGIMPPAYDPAASLTYRCVLNEPLPPGQFDTFAFTVQRATPLGVSGDLTFRADSLGRTVLSDGNDPPDHGAAGYPYYSKDNILARIIGFNLRKGLSGDCSEDNPPPVNNNRVLIGEECTLRVEAEWFGFATPGFGNVEIRNARIYEGSTANNPPALEAVPATDPPNLPDALDGQGLVGVTFNNTAGVTVDVQNPPAPAALAETGLAWRLNNIQAVGNTEESFIANLRFRTLNDPVNSSAAPNVHAALRTDEVNARFDVYFTGTGESYTFDENSGGYPPQSLRDEGLRIIEPQVTLTKEVCNESISIAVNPANSGANCTPFVSAPATLSGDSDDSFIYRLRASNQNAAGGFQRAPAFDLSIDDAADSSDQMAPLDFTSDGLDNDGDGAIDGADADGEGTVDDLVLLNGDAANIHFSGANSAALTRLDPGATATLLYRAQLAGTVTPTQQLTNTASGSYDSLPGAAGAQSAPQGASGALTGARVYNLAPAQATIEIDNIMVNPGSKEYPDTSRRDAGLVPGVCVSPCVDENVVIGEEVLVELEFTLPLSQLRQFSVEDNLPPGMECVEAMDIALPAFNPPGVDPGFTPGGTFPAGTCNATQVRWDLSTAGDQTLQGSGAVTQYTVQARFIARVSNIASNVDGVVIRNGGTTAGGGTDVFVTYRDASNTLVTIPIAEARLTVQEPSLQLTKTMAPVAPNVSVDAVDTINVTVQIQNSGTSPAYNIQLQDTLDTNLSFLNGSLGGANPPDSVDLTNPAQPRFIYNANNPLPAATTFTFTYQMRADSDVQPLEVLSNSLSARFTSLPDNTVALNGAGMIGGDGAADGMRIGYLPPFAGSDPLNDYEAQTTASLTVPGLNIVKNDLDPGVVPTIGVRKHFQIVINLPESVANGVSVTDNLAAGDTSFVLENDAGFDVTYSLQDITSINGVSVGTLTTPEALEAALVAFTGVDEATGPVTWNFGTVVTANEDDAAVNNVNPRIVIDYYARVANDSATVAGVDLENAAETDFNDGETGTPTPPVVAPPVPPVTVVEPDLQVDKQFIDLAPPTPAGTVIQGQAAEFQILVANVGGSAAWDATIVDMLPNRTDADLPGGMCGAAPTITQIEVNGRALVPGTDYTASFTPPASAADLYCSYTIVLTPEDSGAPNDNARIEPGETLLIRYQTVTDIGTPNNSSLTNVAGATRWFSLDTDGVTVPPEVREYDRTLTLRPDPNPGTVGIDDHQDAVTVQTLSPILAVTKSVMNLTTGQNPGVTASPGDTLRYTIVIDNTGAVPASGVQVLDEVDELNAPDFADGFFENSPAGTLRNVTVSVAATDNSAAGGGAVNSGLLDLSDITVPAGGSVTITFDIDVEDPGTPLPHAFIENIAHVDLPGFNTIDSNVTQTEIINTATGFEFDKDSQDLTGDPDVLVAGDTLRYTISIKNVGVNDPAVGLMHAVNVHFRDQVPAHTTYVSNSTRLNGVLVADSAPGVPPFITGMLVNSPDSAVPGFMTANPDPLDTGNVATISFEVTINRGLINGTVISNHGLLTGQEQALPPFTPLPFPGVVSDDPNTITVPDDPTQDTVGSGVNVDALKTAAVVTGGDAVPDTGETLRYTIVIVNRGNTAANNVRLIDAVPAGTAFVSGSVTLNGIAVPDTGTSPLIAGIPLSSDDLTPPLPTAGNGQLSAGGHATVVFDVTITAPAGTAISNQGTVRASEQPDEPTDADGDDENGDQPTVVVVGGAAELKIAKEVVIIGGGTAQANGQLEYRIRVENTGDVPANNVVVTDDMPALTAYVAGSGEIDGLTAGVSFAGSTLTADYSSVYGPLAPGDSFTVTFRVTIDAGAQAGDDIDNTATVDWTGGSASDDADIDIGGAPGVINLSGRVWDNRGHDDAFNAGEPPLAGWRVRVYVNNDNPLAGDTPLAETVTDDQGLYNFTGLAPVDPGDADGAYTLTFSVPDDAARFPAGSNVGLGDTISDFGNPGLMMTGNINVPAGRNAQDESLPVDPMGVVYNSITRRPVQGARVRLYAGNNPVSASCFTTPNRLDAQQGQITSALGFYRFDLNFSGGDCPPAGADFVIRVETPSSAGGFLRNVSDVIPPETGTLDVAACPNGPNDRVPAPPPDTCEVQVQGTAPGPSIPEGLGTRYFPGVNLESGPEELFNNHLPVDTDVGALLAITKQTPLKNVTRGQLVPYTITVSNNQDFPVAGMEVRDFFPPGFKYVRGSAVIDGRPVEPVTDASSFNDASVRAGTLTWSGLTMQANQTLTLKLLLVVGAGVGEGEYTNQAQVFVTGFTGAVSGRASATVRVVPDPTFDCSDVIGKVYDDRNANGYQDDGEPGIAGARIATVQGLLSTTDKYGRFHITCAAIPDADRGSNFILKLDERSLPSGYRVITENPRVQRLTRGKIAKFNFGVTLHRVVRLDLADQAFEFGGTAIQEHWRYVLDDLLEQLRGQPSILRITYLAEHESKDLAQQRLKAVHDAIEARWRELHCCYDLKIESELFWRTGGPE
ncbi:MAG TPA: hypothetical protein VFX02_03465 [Gammaproteobacteria bacterium]|nr:hypothetical protein [Gammaproteobacteria bacterium]